LISSSRIRESIRTGEIESANRLLTEPYRIRGRVVTGAKRGTTIGFPTANLAEIDTLIPGHAVYAARVTLDGHRYAVALNIGPNPTFGENSAKVEAHIIHWNGNIYDQVVELEILTKLRDVQRFANVTELIAQLNHDVEKVKLAVPLD
jgi:riboflavin kinase/FMN adenylyltransferase